MKGIILAAGRGSRMGVMTDHMPKCMIKINDKTLLDNLIVSFKKAGVKKILIITGYLSEKIPKNLNTIYNPNWENSNMVSSLMCADEWIRDDEFVFSYSDIYFEHHMLEDLLSSKDDLSTIYDLKWLDKWKERFDNPLSDAESLIVDNCDNILEIGQKTKNYDNVQGQYIGISKFSNKGWKIFKKIVSNLSSTEIKSLSMTEAFNLIIQKKIRVKGIKTKHFWGEVDSKKDFNILRNKLYSENF
ncbi:phosphocholine cytidylyltransferase family protein [Alphaproteobacteria bacterium]|nr:phosphocholine cytidylyltransferase family protein [Alphaproteobacteria bacterium]